MLKKIVFPVVLVMLGWVLFISPTFKEVAAGVSILLFGILLLEEGFNAFVEGPLKKILSKATDKLYKSLGLGFLVTAFLQSSSLISVITISFISAGLIDLAAGIGIVFGANLGTTASAWLVTLFGLNIKVSALAMPMLAFGIVFVFQKTKSLKGIGQVLAGLGFFFLGIHFMKEGFESYQNSIHLADFAMTGIGGLIVYSFVGIGVTVVLQSSSAAMALIITALAVSQITYNNALALAIGANVGTTITALIGSMSANYAGKRLAGAHLIFNIVTGVVALVLLQPLEFIVDLFSSVVGISETNYALKLSIFHTVFNLLGIIVMIPFIGLLVRLLTKIIKEKEAHKTAIEYPVFLNESILTYPQTALQAVRDESKRLFEQATFEIIAHGLNIHRSDIQGNEKLKKVIEQSTDAFNVDVEEMYFQKIKIIYSKIIKYTSIAQGKFHLSPEDMMAFTRIKLANRNIVEIIKELRGIRQNVNLYQNAENPHIKKEYDKLRHKISKVLREVYINRENENPKTHLKRLEKLKQETYKNDILIDGTIDHLIREKKISSSMATALIHDSESVAEISKRLIETSELLYINSDTIVETSVEENEVSNN